MASPQKENGYTPIANELMEALARTDLSSGESRVLRVIFRKTYGWTKPNDQISLSMFTQMTGMTRRGVCKSISSLVSRRILAREQKGTSFVTKYWVLKDYDKWQAREQKGTSEQKDTSTREREGHLLGNRKAPTTTTIQQQKKQRVIPPVIEDVFKYCLERKNDVDPQKWHDFYSAKGWMIGKNQMKDWQAAVRTWENKKSTAPNWNNPEGKL